MAAAPSTLGDQIREELSCSICLELFTRPKVLPCQHTFCQDCLKDLARKKARFQCPNCRRRVKIPAQGVTGLPDNHLVGSLCDRISNQPAVSTEEQGNSEVDVSEEQAGNNCDKHPSEKLRVYCKQCLVPVCDECLDQDHAGHTTMSLKKAMEERSASIKTSVDQGKNVLESYLAFLRDLRNKEKEATERKEETVNNITQKFDQKVQKLTRSKDMLLKEVEEDHSRVLETIQKSRDEVLEEVAELSTACESAEEAIDSRNSKCLIQETSLKQIVKNHIGKDAPTPVQIDRIVFVPNIVYPKVGNLTTWAVMRDHLFLSVACLHVGYNLYGYDGFLRGCVFTIFHFLYDLAIV
ncbi:PREDICTED: tripartite motif-containing protein 2-like [Branchiostoma belcheri]|uniref:Tripartite motif-containing protein 2-like n=1 Tax=Branchiostoma belcheri TaxID=7741 RepID=A0A6P4YEB1_BRABE|nr:PREDICTED: tripartite motif-containing protein 2-like [Branchiostoma belcheri]